VALFEFELFPVESIAPWGEPERPQLSWFALSLGSLRIPLGQDVLLEYTPEIRARWGGIPPYPDHQLAELARDVLGSVASGRAPLPSLFGRLVRDPELLHRVSDATFRAEKDPLQGQLAHPASRWLGERSPWLGYLTACPRFSFFRVDADVHIVWDNRDRLVEGIPVWTATRGVFVMPEPAFVAECRSFADRLLGGMKTRLERIEAGQARVHCPVDMAALREQHRIWEAELEAYLAEGHQPDVDWSTAEAALRAIATGAGFALPGA
jgi:hypothetical protein